MPNNNAALPESERHILDQSRILYMDEQCIVVNKLCGEAVEGAGAGMGDLPLMLKCALKNTGICQPEPVAVNRLDVPVSGCALFALTQEALVFLNKAFAESEGSKAGADSASVEKFYWAIIEKPSGEIPAAAQLTHWIEFDKKHNKSRAHDAQAPGRKKAMLEYRIIGSGNNYLFLEARLFTGRHHQIRCQFERMGLHIKGDLKYSARRSEPGGGIRLHARSLVFPNPSGSGRISVQAPPPVMDNLWQAFSGAGG